MLRLRKVAEGCLAKDRRTRTKRVSRAPGCRGAFGHCWEKLGSGSRWSSVARLFGSMSKDHCHFRCNRSFTLNKCSHKLAFAFLKRWHKTSGLFRSTV